MKLRPATIEDIELLKSWDEQPHIIAADPNDDWEWELELDGTAMNIAVAVRTLVMGITALATSVFAIVTVGLVALGIQLAIQKISSHAK